MRKSASRLPLKSARWRIGCLGNNLGRLGHKQADAAQPLGGAESEHRLEHLRVGGDTLPLLDRTDEARGGQHFEALIDADEEFRRNDRGLDRTELRAFDLPRDRAELARRKDLGLDAAAGILLDRGGEIGRINGRAPAWMVGVVIFIT